MLKFNAHTNYETKALELVLEGSIDDDMDLPPIDLSGIDTLIIDFELVTGINSVGVKKWMLFQNSMPLDSIRVIFKNCHPPIIDQINLATSFLPLRGKVESFYADYTCEACDYDQEVLFHSDIFDDENIPDHACPQCHANMEFDGDEDYYFLFLES